MTQDEIIEMARQAGLGTPMEWHGRTYIEHGNAMLGVELVVFAKLVSAKEREACAKICDNIDAEYEGEDVLATWCSRAIRARGEA